MDKYTPEEAVNYFIRCARKAAEAGLLSCSSGNLSLRLPVSEGTHGSLHSQDNHDGQDISRNPQSTLPEAPSGLALLSATGSWLEELREEQVALCRISDGQCLNGVQPTMEAGFHLGVMRRRPEINCVLHFQSPYATVVSCMKDKPRDFNVTLEGPLYVGREVPVVPFLPPGSDELAAAVTDALSSHDIVLMSNHGQAACGKDFRDTLRRAVFFEMACRIIVLSHGNYTVI